MNYLLDTNAFLWSLFSPEKLSEKASLIVQDTENTVYVSVITFDRLLVWQSIKQELCLISRDKSLSTYQKYGLTLIW